MFPVTNQLFMEKRGSDHRPILVNLMASHEVYKGQFKFDKRMLHEPLVKECVQNAWLAPNQGESLYVSERIRKCRSALSK